MDINNKSAFAGFIDGYIAKNIETNSSFIAFHSKELTSVLNHLKVDILSNYPDFETKTELGMQLDNSLQALQKNTAVPEIENYVTSGLMFDGFMNNWKQYLTSSVVNQKTETDLLVKKAIYHYLNIAKKTSSAQVEDVARKLALKYK